MYSSKLDNPYLLMTPGPLSTSKGVRKAMLQDWCTWDKDYNEGIVQTIRKEILRLACCEDDSYTTVLLQGSGTFAVEATFTTAMTKKDKVLIINNGAYGQRMVKIAEALRINYHEYSLNETMVPDIETIRTILNCDKEITHVAVVHCETTTGILNPILKIANAVKQAGKTIIVDAMSSFGGIPLDITELDLDFLISSANKCIQGVPGFAFVIAKTDILKNCCGNARSLCLDLYDQWLEMDKSGKWRFTSPTHTVRAFYQALLELEEEGGIKARNLRYLSNQHLLSEGMDKLGYRPLLPLKVQSPIITSFLYPDDKFDFNVFYEKVKKQGFVLYPGKISQADTFRIGNIGEVYSRDISRLLKVIRKIG